MNVVIVVPTYNERESLPVLLDYILAHNDYRVLVVDDQSPDGTGAVADGYARQHPDRVEVMHRTGQRGLGRSYVDGMKRSLAAGADVVCQMDADFSHDPKYLPDLVAATSQYDLVIGSRYLRGISVINWPLRRVILSSFANWYVRTITRLTVRDCTAGFRAWRRDALAEMPIEAMLSEGYAFAVEMTFEAARRGFRIGEVPIIFVERREGVSKMSTRVLSESMLMPWRLVWRGLWRTRTRGSNS
jgi:dolichol-phosphate mannosyltransferase